ncbi:MAG: hypothetical protein PVG90_12620 [Bacillota bacterium]|jgi:hypothetical protein
MKKIHILLLTGLLTLAMVCCGMVGTASGASFYIDYGAYSFGKMEDKIYNNQAFNYEAQDFTPLAAGMNFSFYNIKLGAEYQSGMEPQYDSGLSDEVMTATDDTILGSLGIRLLDRERFELWLNGYYFNRDFKLTGNNTNGMMKYTTEAYLIGPEFNWKITDKLQFGGYLGYAASANQKVNTVANGDLDCSDITVLLYNIKLNYAITDHLAVGAGYRAKEVSSKLPIGAFDAEFTETQRMATVGVTFNF